MTTSNSDTPSASNSQQPQLQAQATSPVPETMDQLATRLHSRLNRVVPPFEIDSKLPVIEEILRLKRERNAIILGHNYMEPLLYYSVPDVVGDSLELCRKAAATDAPIIVFCGVKFMAETAKILNPKKTVLLPSERAGCSLAASITAEDVRALKRRFPGVPVVTYVNTYAEVKAETDICCTSGNAARVLASLGTQHVIFLPDEFLAGNVALESSRTLVFPDEPRIADLTGPESSTKTVIGWRGRCEVHEQFTVADVQRAREHFPNTLVLAHPECPPEVVAKADFAGSTSQMISYIKKAPKKSFLLLTECSMSDNLAAEFPSAEMVGMCSIRCPHMNRITLEDTLAALQKDQYKIELAPEIIEKAKIPLQRMLEL